MASFLFKTEPSQYAFGDLVRDGKTVWSGIKNPTALIHLRSVRKGDTVVIYHSGKDRAAVGLASAASDPYADPELGDPRLVVVDLKPARPFKRAVPIAKFRADATLKTTELIRITRLSVMPLNAAQLKRVLALAEV
ncbi:MAG: EVE domain-containing protein [Candidatus Eiseniibacteriota bacterium]